MSKGKIISLGLLLASTLTVNAQEDSYSNFRDSIMNDFQGFKENIFNEYNEYRNKINEEFISFLNGNWENVNINEGEKKPVDSVPVVPPVIFDRTKPSPQPKPVVKIKPDPTPHPSPQPKPEVPIKKTEPLLPVSFVTEVYGTPFNLSKPDILGINIGNPSNDAITKSWKKLSDGRMDNLLADCLDSRTKYNLNDWAYLQFLNTVAENLSPADSNLKTLILGYLYGNSGYKMRLGRSNNSLVLLFGSQHLIYQYPFYTFDGDRFYPFNKTRGSLEICPAKFPSDQPLSLFVDKPMKLVEKPSEPKILKSTKGITAMSAVNLNLIPFYDSYPPSSINNQTISRWAMTCSAPLSETAENSLYPPLKEKIQGLSTLQQVDLLLNFVQTAFEYEFDDKIWGADRAFFPEETLYYPYNDCEDRTALFTRLVRDLIGLECAIIYYPGHLAAAVCFPIEDNVGGDKINLGGRDFIICDPTYIGAGVGRQMPNVDANNASAIILR